MYKLAVCALVVFLAFGTIAKAEDYYPVVERYDLDVEFIPAKAWMNGQATIFFAGDSDYQQTAVCYLHGELFVDSIVAGGRVIEFSQGKVFYQYEYSLVTTEIRFPLAGLGDGQGVTVYYQGQMNPSSVSSPSDYMRIDRDGVFLRAYGYSLWFPIFLPERHEDYPIDFEQVTIRTPADFYSIFVGQKTNEYVRDTRRITEWTANHVGLFQPQCTAQRYVLTSEGEYYLYHYPDSTSVAMAAKILEFTKRLISRYETIYNQGASSGQCYIMEMPEYGDISSGNVTGLSTEIWYSFEEQDWAQRGLAHELVHPYVSTNTPLSDPLWATAIEGFPSYFHLPILSEILGEKWYNDYIQAKEDAYLKRRETGRGWRDRVLPKEKPLLEITPEELPEFKDMFVINDRILLFLHSLYVKMGQEKFFVFTKDLFSQPELTAASFPALIEKHLPGSADDVHTWLATTEYPERLRLANLR